MAEDPVLGFFTRPTTKVASAPPQGAGAEEAEEAEPPAPKEHDAPWARASIFPLEVYPEVVQQFLRSVAASVCVDLDVTCSLALPVVAALVGASRSVMVKDDWEERPVLWVGIVGPPGSRKSPALYKLVAPMQGYEAQIREAFDQKVEAWRRMSRHEQNEHPELEPVLEQVMLGDVTIETVAETLRRSPMGLLLFRDELSGWVDGMGQYKSGGKSDDRQKWLELWSARTLQVDRMDRHVFVDRPTVNLVGGIQPELVERIAGSRGNDGLADRFLLMQMRPVEETFDSPATPVHLSAAWDQIVQRLFEMRVSTKAVRLDETARRRASELFNAHYQEKAVVRDRFPWRLGFWSKADALAGRLMLILSLLRYAAGEKEDETVNVGDVEDAWKVVDWAKWHHVQVQGEAAPLEYERAGPSLERRVLDWLRSQPRGESGRPEASFRSLNRGPGQRTERREMERVLSTLRDRGLIDRRAGARANIFTVIYTGPEVPERDAKDAR